MRRRLTAFLCDNWRLLLVAVGASFFFRGLRAWSAPLADVVGGAVLVLVAVLPYLRSLPAPWKRRFSSE